MILDCLLGQRMAGVFPTIKFANGGWLSVQASANAKSYPAINSPLSFVYSEFEVTSSGLDVSSLSKYESEPGMFYNVPRAEIEDIIRANELKSYADQEIVDFASQ